ncbi:hypothetical protein ACOKGD_03170 [Microbacterium phosphatis]|uniref:hypothetical protein n=1 Tax=Microbacterium phosphatis TaxID=3140248 RepID=UPI0031401709
MLLTSSDETAAERLGRREAGSALADHLDRSRAAAERLDTAGPEVARVATDGRPVVRIAAEILERAGWWTVGPAAP